MSHLQKRLQLLQYPPFFMYIIAFFAAAIGNGMGYIAISWIVVTYHTSVTVMAILMACFWAPTIIFGPLAGVLADRISRKKMILTSNFFRAAIFIFFSFYLHYDNSVNVIYLMMFCNGLAFTLFYSSAMAFLRELIPPEKLMHANSTIDIMYEVGNVIGMGSAGFLIALTSSETAVLINGLSFLIATFCMFFIPKKALCHGSKKTPEKIRLWEDFCGGLHYLLKRKNLLSIYTIQLLIFITFLTSPLLLVPFSKTVLHADVSQFGTIEAAASVGIVVGGILMPWLSEIVGLMRTLLFFSCMLCVTFFIFGWNHSIPLAVVMYFMIGFSGAIWPLIITRAQSLTDLDFQGRVQSTFNSLSGTLMMCFYFFVGMIGHYFHIATLYLIEVVITAIAILFLVLARKEF